MAFVISDPTDERFVPWRIAHPDQADLADRRVVPAVGASPVALVAPTQDVPTLVVPVLGDLGASRLVLIHPVRAAHLEVIVGEVAQPTGVGPIDQLRAGIVVVMIGREVIVRTAGHLEMVDLEMLDRAVPLVLGVRIDRHRIVRVMIVREVIVRTVVDRVMVGPVGRHRIVPVVIVPVEIVRVMTGREVIVRTVVGRVGRHRIVRVVIVPVEIVVVMIGREVIVRTVVGRVGRHRIVRVMIGREVIVRTVVGLVMVGRVGRHRIVPVVIVLVVTGLVVIVPVGIVRVMIVPEVIVHTVVGRVMVGRVDRHRIVLVVIDRTVVGLVMVGRAGRHRIAHTVTDREAMVVPEHPVAPCRVAVTEMIVLVAIVTEVIVRSDQSHREFRKTLQPRTLIPVF